MLRDTLKTLLAAYGPSGNEHTVAETVKGLIASHVDSMRVDAMGNLIVEKLGTDENGTRIITMFSEEKDYTREEELINSLLYMSPVVIDLTAVDDEEMKIILRDIFTGRVIG